MSGKASPLAWRQPIVCALLNVLGFCATAAGEFLPYAMPDRDELEYYQEWTVVGGVPRWSGDAKDVYGWGQPYWRERAPTGIFLGEYDLDIPWSWPLAVDNGFGTCFARCDIYFWVEVEWDAGSAFFPTTDPKIRISGNLFWITGPNRTAEWVWTYGSLYLPDFEYWPGVRAPSLLGEGNFSNWRDGAGDVHSYTTYHDLTDDIMAVRVGVQSNYVPEPSGIGERGEVILNLGGLLLRHGMDSWASAIPKPLPALSKQRKSQSPSHTKLPSMAQSPWGAFGRYKVEMLQWGRGFSAAETCKGAFGRYKVEMLQWGRGFSAAETGSLT